MKGKTGKYRLRDRELFQQVLKKGQTIHGSFLSLYWLQDGPENQPKVGFAVGKRIGDAAVRNLLRRRLRHTMLPFYPFLRTGVSVIWMARRPCLQASYRQLEQETAALLEKAGLLESS